MKLEFPAAFAPLMDSTVVVKINAGQSSADTLSIKACVRAGNPNGATVGSSGDGEQWTVTFQETSWKSPRQPSRGTIIDADAMAHRWPRLTVQRVFRLGGLITFECSGNEKGGMR